VLLLECKKSAGLRNGIANRNCVPKILRSGVAAMRKPRVSTRGNENEWNQEMDLSILN
jgi:hypothetical protein